jgi:hypothetical protein
MLYLGRRQALSTAPPRLAGYGYHDISILHRRMIPLQHQRPRLLLITVLPPYPSAIAPWGPQQRSRSFAPAGLRMTGAPSCKTEREKSERSCAAPVRNDHGRQGQTRDPGGVCAPTSYTSWRVGRGCYTQVSRMTSPAGYTSTSKPLSRGSPARTASLGSCYLDEFADIRAAIAREKRIKGWTRSRKIKLIEGENPTWEDLAQNWLQDRSSTS